MENYNIKHKVTTPYHPQENGQVEGLIRSLRPSSPKPSDCTSRIGMIDSPKIYGPTEQPRELLQDAHLMS
jgi:hypothetical protein